MKLLFLGNFIPQYSSENEYRQTFEKMGVEVITAQEGQASAKEFYKYDDIDAFFWVCTHGNKTEGILDYLKYLRNKGIPSFALHWDLYYGLDRWKEYKNGEYFKVEYFFTVDKMMADWFNNHTETKGYYVPPSSFDEEAFIAEPNRKRYPHDVIFAGALSYHREWPYRPKLINWLKETYGDRFCHYGNGGQPVIRGKELNVLYASAKVIVGDSLCLNFDYPNYWSDRLPCTLNRAGFIIFPYIKGLEDFYKLGEELITYPFDNFNELKNLIDYYIEHEEERNKIRLAGFERAKNQDTHRHRFQTIFDTLNLSA